jgi:DNA-binding beta-propeller fold protein YncE
MIIVVPSLTLTLSPHRVERELFMTALKTLSINLILTLLLAFFPSKSYSLECINSKSLPDISTEANQPSDLSLGPDGSVYLVDGVNNRVIVLNRDGRVKFTFGQGGTGQGEFEHPLGIDISKDGTVYIADSGNHRVQVFDGKGNFLRLFNVKSGPKEKPSDPVDVLVPDFKDYVYVSDNHNHKIKVYDTRGNFQFEWGEFGEEPGYFRYPGILAKNEQNQIFVVDVLNTRVQKFDPFGNHILDIGSWGVLPGNLFRPKGVAIDRKNRVLVSDSYMGLIQVFTDSGSFLGVVCENGTKRQFSTPVGVFMDSKNDILLTVEMRKNTISVTKIVE